jgi:diguanylate cyclase (GGDEF)-like protein
VSAPTTRIDDLNRRSWDRMLAAPEEALSLAETALAEAQEAGYEAGVAEARLNVGWCENFLTRQAPAIESLQAALDGFTKLGDETGTMKALNALGVVYQEMARYERAMDYYTRSLEEARKRGNRVREAATLSNIGEVCLELGELKEALDYFLRAYETVPDDQEYEIIANVLLNIGTTFHRMENWPLAREFTEKAMEITSASGQKGLEANCWHSLGRITQASGRLELAESHYLKALAIDEELKNEMQRASVLLDLGSLHVQAGYVDRALERYQVALEVAEGIGGKSAINAAYERLSVAYEHKGKYAEALEYYRRFARYEHEVLNEDTSRKIKNITIQYEVDKSRQESEIYRLKNIELKEKTEELEEANRQILAISETGRRITASLDLDTVINTLHEMLGSRIAFDLFGLALYDEEENSLDYLAYIDRGKRIHRKRVSLETRKGFAAACVKRRSSIFVEDTDAEYQRFLEGKRQHYGKPAGSLIFLPLAIDERVIGVLTLQSQAKRAFTGKHLTLLEALAPYVTIAIENSLIHDRLEEANRTVNTEKLRLEKDAVNITHIANHDTLTGLPNRRLLFELLQKTFDIASRNDAKVGVVYIDLDDFKPINDRFGHAAGDRALVAIAERFRTILRASDTVARVGGDEFVAVISTAPDRGHIEKAARKILEGCGAPLTIEGEECRIGLSMGVAVYPDDGTSIELLVNAADAAMYEVKRGKKNGYAFCGGPAASS